MSKNKTVLVRMKPHDPRRGYTCRRYVWRSQLFRSGEWRRVPEQVATMLLREDQPGSERRHPVPLFDVAQDEDEAEAIKQADAPPPETEVEGAKEIPAAAFGIESDDDSDDASDGADDSATKKAAPGRKRGRSRSRSKKSEQSSES